jgi:hypothetical protein
MKLILVHILAFYLLVLEIFLTLTLRDHSYCVADSFKFARQPLAEPLPVASLT